MRKIIIDVLGLTGFGGLMAGVYLRYGVDIALIGGGSLLLLLALASTMRRRP